MCIFFYLQVRMTASATRRVAQKCATPMQHGDRPSHVQCPQNTYAASLKRAHIMPRVLPKRDQSRS